MSNQGLLAAGLTGLLAAGAGVALHLQAPWSSAPRTTTMSSSASAWQHPPDATKEQLLALSKHIHEGAPAPAGFTLIESLGDVTGSLTGTVDAATGEREIKVEVTDDIDDLEEARLLVDGALKATATRANGGIVDRPADGSAIATLDAWSPPDGSSWSVVVQWDIDPGGPVRESSYSVKEPWFRRLLAKFLSG